MLAAFLNAWERVGRSFANRIGTFFVDTTVEQERSILANERGWERFNLLLYLL